MRRHMTSLLMGLALVVSACGVVPQASPFDPVIEDTVTEFDKAFQSFAIDMAGKAGTPAGTHGANEQFYTKWGGELAHLRNRAIATDPADECPLSGDVAEVFQTIAQTSGTASVAALGATDDVFALANAAISAVDTKLEELTDELNQPAGTLTPDQINELRVEIDEWDAKRRRLQNVAAGVASTEVAAPEGGCSTVVVAKLAEQFSNFERVHKAQGDIGIPPQASAPIILMNVAIQNVLKVQAVKKQKTEAGLL